MGQYEVRFLMPAEGWQELAAHDLRTANRLYAALLNGMDPVDGVLIREIQLVGPEGKILRQESEDQETPS